MNLKELTMNILQAAAQGRRPQRFKGGGTLGLELNLRVAGRSFVWTVIQSICDLSKLGPVCTHSPKLSRDAANKLTEHLK
eukprot:1158231-Pelagomonas_calceolata.AAC.3